MSRKKSTPRAERRMRERGQRKLVKDKQRLAALEPGGAPDRAIEVPASPVIDVRARAMRCPLCDGPLRLDEQTADGPSLRAAHVTCVTCGVSRQIWFRISSPLPN